MTTRVHKAFALRDEIEFSYKNVLRIDIESFFHQTKSITKSYWLSFNEQLLMPSNLPQSRSHFSPKNGTENLRESKREEKISELRTANGFAINRGEKKTDRILSEFHQKEFR